MMLSIGSLLVSSFLIAGTIVALYFSLSLVHFQSHALMTLVITPLVVPLIIGTFLLIFSV